MSTHMPFKIKKSSLNQGLGNMNPISSMKFSNSGLVLLMIYENTTVSFSEEKYEGYVKMW